MVKPFPEFSPRRGRAGGLLRRVAFVLMAGLTGSMAKMPSLRFEGNRYVGEGRLKAEIPPPEGADSLTGVELRRWSETAAAILEEFYVSRGFFDAKVTLEWSAPETTPGGGVGVSFRIREGGRYRFASVGITARDSSRVLVDLDELEAVAGHPFDYERILLDKRKIAAAYGDHGYVHARVAEDVAMEPRSRSVRLEYVVEPGHLVVFDTLLVRNGREGGKPGIPGLTRPGLFASLLNLRRGDTVSDAKIMLLERKLRSTGVFSYLHIRDSLLEDTGGRSALVLESEEAVPGELEYVLFYETQYGAGVSSYWRHRNLGGRLHHGKLSLSLAQRSQSLGLGYGTPLLFGSSVRLDNDLYLSWYQDREAAGGHGPFRGDFEIANDVQFSRALTSWARLVSSAELRGESQLRPDGSRLRALNLNYINSVHLAFVDNPVSPARGGRASLTSGNGGPFVHMGEFQLLESRHNWVDLRSAVYLPLNPRFATAARLDGGRFFGVAGINSQRFFLGGPRSVRSYGWRKICPRRSPERGCATDIEPAYVLGSVELRMRPFPVEWSGERDLRRHLGGLQLVPFADYGAVWTVGGDLFPEGEGRAYGLGLRYSLFSAFNLRLDYAVDGPERRHSQWVVDLAQAF